MAKLKISSPSPRKELEKLAKEILMGFKDLEKKVKTFQAIAGKIVAFSPKVTGKLTPSVSKVGKVKRVRRSSEEVREELEQTKTEILGILTERKEPINGRSLWAAFSKGKTKKNIPARPVFIKALYDLKSDGRIKAFGRGAATEYSFNRSYKRAKAAKSIKPISKEVLKDGSEVSVYAF